jgi:hypothetical protein
MGAYSRARHCWPGRRLAPIALSFDPYPYLLPLNDHLTRWAEYSRKRELVNRPCGGWRCDLCAEHEPRERAPVRCQLVAGTAQQWLAGGAQLA